MFSKSEMFFLDLEQTIIRAWDQPDLINLDKIRKFLTANKADEVRIFSFAIWDDKDKNKFSTEMKPRIEEALDLPVQSWPSCQDMMRADFQHTGVRFEKGHEISEFIQLRGKKDAFIHFVCNEYRFNRAVLIDDVVPDLTLSHRTQGWAIELWNVDNL